MKITFYGTRGSIASPGAETVKYGGNTTCLFVEFDDGTCLIIDSGTGIRKLGKTLIKEGRPLDNINMFITHSHWDHIQGFPFFIPAYHSRAKIHIYGCPPSWKKLSNIISDQMESAYFPVNFNEMSAQINFIEGCRAMLLFGSADAYMIRTNHPGTTYGIRITEKGRSMVFLTDNELNPSGSAHTSFEDFAGFIKGADILIHDAQYTEKEYTKKRGWGHSLISDVLGLGIESGVSRLILTHHDPERTDRELDELQAKCRRVVKGKGMETSFAIEGTTLNV